MKRAFLAGSTAIGLVFLGGVLLVHRLTTPSPRPGRPPPSTPPAAAPPATSRVAPVPAPAIAVPPAAAVSPPAAAASPPARRKPAPAPQPLPRPGVGSSGPSRLALEFKLDPRLTRSLHMGDRWVSPPMYTRTGGPRSVTLDARARLLGERPSRAKPSWISAEPDMVEVSPDLGEEVEITVWREGESQLTVTSGDLTRTLMVKATPLAGGLRVDITQ